MKRYAINLTAMQWGLIAVDLGRLRERPSDSTTALTNLIRVALEHTEDPERDLPFNVSEV